MLKAAVVILNYNGHKHLAQFLPSVVEHTPPWAKVFVADNGSTDNSISFLANDFPAVEIIELKENYGFAGGYNRALEQIKAEYFILLNSDCEVSPGWMSPIDKLDQDPEIAAAQPKLKDYSKRDHFEYAGASGGFIDKYGFPFCRGRIFDTCERDIGQHDDPREVFWATGACLFIRSTAFWEVGGLDEDLFAHMEEIDLCWRLKNRGYSIFCFPDSVVYHLGGGTLHAQNAFKTYLNFRNNLIIIVKNDYAANYGTRFFKRLLLDGLAAFHFLIFRGPSHFIAILRAHFHHYSRIRSTRSKRKALMELSENINRSGNYRRSITKAYFIRGIKVFSALGSKDFVRQSRNR